MQVGAINNIGLNSVRNIQNNSKLQNTNNHLNSEINFQGDNKKTDSSKLRNATVALFLVPIASAPLLTTGCGDYVSAEAWVKVNGANQGDSTAIGSIDSTINENPDWLETDKYEIPQLLDTLFTNFKNWQISGLDTVDRKDSTALKNIIHYKGSREWDYGNQEVGDMNLKESSKKNLVYDTEILDYKGNHINYGKTVLRLPDKKFTLITKDGKKLSSPNGFFYEQYTCKNDKKGTSLKKCDLVNRAFCQTNGDTLFVAKYKGTNSDTFVEKGRVLQGYAGDNSILLENMIGKYDTDDHIVGVKIKTVSDDDLQKMYKESQK